MISVTQCGARCLLGGIDLYPLCGRQRRAATSFIIQGRDQVEPFVQKTPGWSEEEEEDGKISLHCPKYACARAHAGAHAHASSFLHFPTIAGVSKLTSHQKKKKTLKETIKNNKKDT